MCRKTKLLKPNDNTQLSIKLKILTVHGLVINYFIEFKFVNNEKNMGCYIMSD